MASNQHAVEKKRTVRGAPPREKHDYQGADTAFLVAFLGLILPALLMWGTQLGRVFFNLSSDLPFQNIACAICSVCALTAIVRAIISYFASSRDQESYQGAHSIANRAILLGVAELLLVLLIVVYHFPNWSIEM